MHMYTCVRCQIQSEIILTHCRVNSFLSDSSFKVMKAFRVFKLPALLFIFVASMTYLEIYKHVKHVIVEVAEQPYIHHDLRQRVVKLTNQTKVPLDLRPMEDYLKTHDTSILMYNRVPKTGSSSMRTMLINLARVCDFMN